MLITPYKLVIEPTDKEYKGELITQLLAKAKEFEDKASGSCITVIYFQLNNNTYWTYYKHILSAHQENTPIRCHLKMSKK